MRTFLKPLVVLMTIGLIACANTPSSVHQLAPLNEPAAPGKSKFDIYRTKDALYLDIKARVKINGERVAELGGGETFSANYDSGKLFVVFVDADAWSAPGYYLVEFKAEPDTEYLLEIAPQEEFRRTSVSRMAVFGMGALLYDTFVNANGDLGPFKITLREISHRNGKHN
jgi:hypothetical protein